MDSQKIGQFIKTERQSQQLTQKELATLLQCTDKAVSRWETGKGVPDVSLLIPLSRALDVSVNELLLGERIEEEMKEQRSEEVIINTMQDAKKHIGKMQLAIAVLFCLLQIAITYGFTVSATPSDAMGLLIGVIGLLMAVCFLFGFTGFKIRYKVYFVLFTAVIYFPSHFLYWEADEAFGINGLYTPILLVGGIVLVLLATGLKQLITHIVNKMKKAS